MNRPLRVESKNWTVLSLLQKSAREFQEREIDSPRLTAELLLAQTLGLRRLDLYLQFGRPVPLEGLARFQVMVERRLAGEPTQYILEEAPFRDLTLKVDPSVLIPRSETEVLVGEIVRWLEGHPTEGTRKVLDLGTGSGAIALALVQEVPNTRAVATDISEKALEVARANAFRHGLEDLVEFRQGDLFEPLKRRERFDVLVSNPPYVAEEEYYHLQREVREHEPAVALRAGPTGLEVIRRIVREGRRHLIEGGLLALELRPDRIGEVIELVQENGSFESLQVIRDLSHHPRGLLAVRT